jgi:protein-S-isoprenylcysteine O-methyltransferase Ste14
MLARRGAQVLVKAALQGAVLFVSAGTVRWPAGWLYVGLYVGVVAVGAVVLVPSHRDVVEERSKGRQGAVSWDRHLTRALTVAWLGILVVAGLAQRWGWLPELPSWLVAVGVAVFLLGSGIMLWAMAANPFFAQVVRIQTERGHTAVADGPYRFVRHPGYSGMCLSTLGTALLLGSSWALLPWAGCVALLVLRTSLEDQTLAGELDGYREYRTRTRYRLVPGIW